MALEGIDQGVLAGGVIGALIAGALLLAILIGLAIYVYLAWAWMSIAKKKKHPYPWLAWIPGANVALVYQMGGFHWAWAFLILGIFIPYVGVIFSIAVFVLYLIAQWRIFEYFKYPGWLSLALVVMLIPFFGFFVGIAYLVLLGIVAWGKPRKKR